MAGYLALQIIKGKMTYKQVVAKFGKYKESVDAVLTFKGREDLIVE